MKKDIDVSIDRLTIMATNVNLEKYLGNDPYIESTGMSSNFGFNYSYKGQKGELIEVGREKIRIDFNPNKSSREEILKMLKCVKYVYFTRIDIAIDYFGVSFEEFEWVDEVKNRKQNEWRTGSKGLETLYIGSPSSDKRFRIYDKKKERLDAEETVDVRGENGHWRVEIQKRFKESESLFEGKEYLDKMKFDIFPRRKNMDLSSIENPIERMTIAGLLQYPSEIHNFAKNTKTKYNKMLKSLEEKNVVDDIELPEKIFQTKKELLVGELEALMNSSLKRFTDL